MNNYTINNIRINLLFLLILLTPLSLYPSISLPILNYPSFRIGLYQFIALVFVSITIMPALKSYKVFLRNNKLSFYTLSMLVFLLILNGLILNNTLRTVVLTLSILLLVAVLYCSWWIVQIKIKEIKYKFITIYLLFGILLAFLALFQLTYGTFNNTGGLLCNGCTSAVFGFPRINLSAAEPLFLANAILPFLFISLAFWYKNNYAKYSFFTSTVVIGLTFSRGAIFASFIGLILFLFLENKLESRSIRQALIKIILYIAALLTTGLLLTASAVIKYSSNNPNIAYETMQSAVEHLTLGIISLPVSTISKNTSPISDNNGSFTPSGLIEDSTSERTDTITENIEKWNNNIINIIFGSGIGSTTNKQDEQYVSNFYIVYLTETGALGLIILLLFISSIVLTAIRKKMSILNIAILSLVISFLLQFMFFNSYINVIYFWLFMGILFALSHKKGLILIHEK